LISVWQLNASCSLYITVCAQDTEAQRKTVVSQPPVHFAATSCHVSVSDRFSVGVTATAYVVNLQHPKLCLTASTTNWAAVCGQNLLFKRSVRGPAVIYAAAAHRIANF
jgi:hypothetical protein